MIIKTTYVMLCIYSVKSLCEDTIRISLYEENKSKDSIEESVKKRLRIIIGNPINSSVENVVHISSGSSSCSIEYRIPSDSSRQTEPNIKKMINSRSNKELSGSKADPNSHYKYPEKIVRSFDDTKDIWEEEDNDNMYRKNIHTEPHNKENYRENMQTAPLNHKLQTTTYDDYLDHEDIQMEQNYDSSYREEMQKESHEDNMYNKNKQTTLLREDIPVESKIIDNQEIMRDAVCKHNVNRRKTRTTLPDEDHAEITRLPHEDNLYHEETQTLSQEDNLYHGKKQTVSDEDNLNQKEMHHRLLNAGVNRDKMQRIQREYNLYREKMATSAEDKSYPGKMLTTSSPNDSFRPVHMRSASTNGDIYPEKLRNMALENIFYYKKMQTAPSKSNIYHEILQSSRQDDYSYYEKRLQEPKSLRKMPTEPLKSFYSQQLRSVIETTNEAEILEPSNSIEVSGHDDQESKNLEESEDERDYIYTVSIQRKGAHYASGALVGARWVLSTAAEFYNVRESIKLFRMRVGSANCKKGGVVSPIKTITIHPDFTPGMPSYDVAILRTAELVAFSSVLQPIGLSRISGKVVEAKFLTTYWPRIVVNKGVIPTSAKERIKFNSMRVSRQELVPSEQCSKLMAAVNVTLNKSCLCLQPVKAHHSDCMPDVGAPVVAVDGLWGITSGWVSPLCPEHPLPTVFTRVSSRDIRNWINSEMAE